jgi:transposase
MSTRELDRLQVLVRVTEKRLTQREAARQLGVTERQLRRLLTAYRAHGPAGLVSKKRGRRSNNRLPDDAKAYVVELVRERYADFGPTFAQEKLQELHGLRVSVTTLRSWMTEVGLWVPRAQRQRRIQQPRQRRECRGELIQVDGSDHHWFEDRAGRCTLLVYIDDATGALMQLWFCDGESTFNYFEATRRYVEKHGKPGKPVAFYSDKASVFRVNAKAPKSGDGFTQFGRAMGDLNVETMCANTPQAKGRVERVNSTLQDRLVKELRLAGISTIDEANEFVVGFIESFNKRFARPALNAHDAHRPVLESDVLPEVLMWREKRKVSKSLTLHYKRVMYLLEDTPEGRAAMGCQVDLVEDHDGNVRVQHKGRVLRCRAFNKEGHVHQAAIVDNKVLGAALQYAKELQDQRDDTKLKSGHTTKRDKRLLLEARRLAASAHPV